MAWDFAAEIHALSNYDADDASGTGISGEVLSLHATQWLTDGAKEVVIQLPAALQKKCAVVQTFTSAAAGSEAETLGEGGVLSVFAGSVSCRLIANSDKYKAADSGDILYATATDPAYYFEADKINVLPASLTCKYEEVQFPTVGFADNGINNFPDEAEYLVVLYAATKACSHQMVQFQTDTAIDTTALGAIKTELDKADNNILIAYNKIVEYYTEIADLDNDDLWDDTNKRFDEVKLSLENAMSLIGLDAAGDKYHADYDLEAIMSDIDTQLNAEDIELAGARMQQAQTQMNAVSSHLSTAQTAMSEINGLVQKHSLPLAGVPQLISTATGYISQAAGYVSEVQSRMTRANQKYTWYDSQYAKLFAEYTRGLAALKGS